APGEGAGKRRARAHRAAALAGLPRGRLRRRRPAFRRRLSGPFLVWFERTWLVLAPDQRGQHLWAPVRGGAPVELDVFARFHSARGSGAGRAGPLRAQTPAVRLEAGCVYTQACRSKRDAAQFFLFSRWTDEPAFQVHADLPTTSSFISRMEQLSDQPVDV